MKTNLLSRVDEQLSVPPDNADAADVLELLGELRDQTNDSALERQALLQDKEDLLAALEHIMSSRFVSLDEDATEIARAAIAKARGTNPQEEK